ncbi:MAG: Gfo/Idh/MocA family protein [Thermoanaerobaculia bacterium]
MLKGALFGAGNVAVNGHLPGWRGRTEATLVAGADTRDAGRAAFLDAFPKARWYGSAQELLAAEALDFVDIATAPAAHAGLVRAALERSLHVLCEKPLVLRREDVAPLATLARERARALVTVHNWKYAPALEKVTRLLEEGAVGDVRRCRWETLRTQPAVAAGEGGNWRVGPAQSGGGILMDHGWHALYVVAGWLGASPRSVKAKLETRKHHAFPIEDTATMTLEYPTASAEIVLTWAAGERANRIAIEGTLGKLRLDGGRVTLAGAAGKQSWSLPSIAEGSHHPEWFGGVLLEFLGEIADPGMRGRNLTEAAFCADALEQARESSRLGGKSLPL